MNFILFYIDSGFQRDGCERIKYGIWIFGGEEISVWESGGGGFAVPCSVFPSLSPTHLTLLSFLNKEGYRRLREERKGGNRFGRTDPFHIGLRYLNKARIQWSNTAVNLAFTWTRIPQYILPTCPELTLAGFLPLASFDRKMEAIAVLYGIGAQCG